MAAPSIKSTSQRLLRLQLALPAIATTMMYGLEWRPLREKNVTRQAKASAKSHTHYVVLGPLNEGAGTVVGMYAPPPGDDGKRLPKNAISAAMAFASLVREEDPFAALVLTLPDSKLYVVVLDDGFVTTDRVCTPEEVSDVVQGKSIYSDNEVNYPGETASWEWLESAQEQSKLLPIPVDSRIVIAMAVVGALVLAGIGAGAVWKQQQIEKKKRAAIIAAQAADPAPKYSAALVGVLAQAKISSDSWRSFFAELESAEITAPGWLREGFVCDTQLNNCTSTWTRKGGTSPELINQLGAINKCVVALDLRQATCETPLLLPGSPLDPSGLKTATDWKAAYTPLQQNWITAGLSPSFGQPTLWPSVDGVPAEYRGPDTIGRIKLIVTVPGVFVNDILSATPSNAHWTQFNIKLNHGDDRASVVVTLEGYAYVALR